MRTLFIVNDAPCGSEKMFNALRLAMALQNMPHGRRRGGRAARTSHAAGVLQHRADAQVGDGRGRPGQTLWDLLRGAGTQGPGADRGGRLSAMPQLADWTATSDKVLVF